MEQTGEPGKIQVSPEMGERIRASFVLEPRGLVEVRGKGPMPTWLLTGRSARDMRAG